MQIWQTPHILDESHISTVLILPAGSTCDRFPHQHHLLEHLIFEIEVFTGITLREYLDSKGIQSKASTSRDLITIAFMSKATKQQAICIGKAITCIATSKWSKDVEDNVASTLENEMFSISSNIMQAARISAEFAYWGECANLDSAHVHTTMDKLSSQLPSYLETLMDSSLVLIDDPTSLLYDSLSGLLTKRGSLSMQHSCCNKTSLPKPTSFQVPIRPVNLSSIVFGVNRELSTVEQLSMLAVSYCLSRGMRNGLLWQEIQRQHLALYHIIAWFQAASKDAILSIDWISPPDKEPLIKNLALSVLDSLTKKNELLMDELPYAISEIQAQSQTIKAMPVVDRLKAIGSEILSGNKNLSFDGVFNQIGCIKLETCASLLSEFMDSPLLFINQMGQAQFQ